jgi:hypothetical protein
MGLNSRCQVNCENKTVSLSPCSYSLESGVVAVVVCGWLDKVFDVGVGIHRLIAPSPQKYCGGTSLI